MFKLYEVAIYYEKENMNRNIGSFSYMDVLNSEEDIYGELLERHSSYYMITDIVFKEVVFEGYQIGIVKTGQ